MYQRMGKIAFKKDLSNTLALCHHLGDPHHAFRSVHIAGTNGKGSSAHMLASILTEAGYKTGLYTSPHLQRFTERIRIDGIEIDETFVVEFVRQLRDVIEKIRPSFFELTVAMAFRYFADEQVDIAIVEVGLGGRLDSTNVLTPLVSLITNISLDHTDMLGNTLEEIAAEKAGIIKDEVPVVISEYQPEVAHVFKQKAKELNAPLFFASKKINCSNVLTENQQLCFNVAGSKLTDEKRQCTDLSGHYQLKNIPGVLNTLEILNDGGFDLNADHIRRGLSRVALNTGLNGRWQILGHAPLIVCDTAHNEAGIAQVVSQINTLPHNRLFIIWGMVKDKAIKDLLKFLPKRAYYYFCEANIPRALPAEQLAAAAAELGLEGSVLRNVNDALDAARKLAGPDDIILISGSNFIISELSLLNR